MRVYIFIISCLGAALHLLLRLRSFWKNVQVAKDIGLPYYISPFDPVDEFSQALSFAWIPVWKFLAPRRYWDPIIEVFPPGWAFKHRYDIFERLGHDTFILVTPRRIILRTANPQVIDQVTSRREDFPKALESYKILSLFGDNILSTEGNEWRLHRKLTAPTFNESNMARIFEESTHQAQCLVAHWLNKGKRQILRSLEEDIMELAFNVISFLGFGLRVPWSHEPLPNDISPDMMKYIRRDNPEGYQLAFRTCLTQLVHNIFLLFLLPKALLDHLPFKAVKQVKIAKDSFPKYLSQFLQEQARSHEEGNVLSGAPHKSASIRAFMDVAAQQKLLDSPTLHEHILSNAFILYVAGYESSASVIHFTLLQLANNPTVQRQLQRDVDRIFQGDDPKTWSYQDKFNLMMDSTLGTAMLETLRWMPPIVEIPKVVSPSRDQTIVCGNSRYVIPRNSRVGLPTEPSKVSGLPTDLDDWVPGRWNRTNEKSPTENLTYADNEDFHRGPDTGRALYRPLPGSYMPFSLGARGCLGRRMAQVEILVTLAVIFQKYSLENVVDDWADDEELELMSRQEKASLYAKATLRSRDTIKRAFSIIIARFHGSAHVPVTLMPRGEERFVN
ncbi:cytochrome P450 [Xylaria cubensis]|nr:cytochrome P450 [Xylaria cubensis]